MGKRERNRERAQQAVPSWFGAEWARHRTGMTARRSLLEDEGLPVLTRAEVVADVVALFSDTLRRTRERAERRFGRDWLRLLDTDEAALRARLWNEHVEPLTGLGWDDVDDVTGGPGSAAPGATTGDDPGPAPDDAGDDDGSAGQR